MKDVLAMENSMVLPSITPREYEQDEDAEVLAICPACEEDILEETERTVTNGAGVFCNQACASRHLYATTETASGKAALLRFVAALNLLVQEDVLARVPKLGFRDFDMDTVPVTGNPNFKVASIVALRQQAMHLLDLFDVEGEVEWARKATDLSTEFSEILGKGVK